MENKIFNELSNVDVSSFLETKNGLIYLSWADAVKATLAVTDFTYEIEKNPQTGLPYWCDPLTGYMVFTKITIEGVTKCMFLPVMDSNNKAMKCEPYQYNTKNGPKSVETATMFDINKTIMRCLVKNLAMFGLGLNVYTGEDLPETSNNQSQTQRVLQQPRSRVIQPQIQSESTGIIQNPVTQPQQQSQYPATKTITVNGYTVDYKLGFSKKNNEYYYVLVDLNAQSIGANKYLKVDE